jgi:hypothetical protein
VGISSWNSNDDFTVCYNWQPIVGILQTCSYVPSSPTANGETTE